MPFADLPNARIHYSFSGNAQGPVLVLSNSLGTNFSLWDPQTAAFERQFHLLRYDMRGHGQSSSPPAPYSVPEFTADLLALAAHLGVGRFHFCGLSVGGMIGMCLGLTAASRINKLVLCNTGPSIGTVESWKTREDIVRRLGMKEVARITPDRWFTRRFQAAEPETVARMMRVVESTDPEGYIAACNAVRDYNVRSEVARIQLPTLVISGAHDPATPPADGRFIAERIAGARYVELDAAHLSNVEQADAFTREVISFLQS
ncbi:MAG TPA: 3-oxoadipate enol-lactonase [Dongiaceae bacterium]|nr:3-oxoadipate enol-lactonase [Dongiaceae bacterium]